MQDLLKISTRGSNFARTKNSRIFEQLREQKKQIKTKAKGFLSQRNYLEGILIKTNSADSSPTNSIGSDKASDFDDIEEMPPSYMNGTRHKVFGKSNHQTSSFDKRSTCFGFNASQNHQVLSNCIERTVKSKEVKLRNTQYSSEVNLVMNAQIPDPFDSEVSPVTHMQIHSGASSAFKVRHDKMEKIDTEAIEYLDPDLPLSDRRQVVRNHYPF